jgi:hypothetical protein
LRLRRRPGEAAGFDKAEQAALAFGAVERRIGLAPEVSRRRPAIVPGVAFAPNETGGHDFLHGAGIAGLQSGSRTGFENQVEGRLGGPAEGTEPRLGEDVRQARLTRITPGAYRRKFRLPDFVAP